MRKFRVWPRASWPRKRCRCPLSERERLVNDVQHELFGLGPLEPLLADPTISDILVNRHDTIYIERRGKIEATNVSFQGRRTLDARDRAHRFFSRPSHR